MRIIVTGGNSGMGRATAIALAAQGHDVVKAQHDPGATDTDIARDATGFAGWLNASSLPRPYLHTPEQGARASIEAVTTTLPSGTYLAPRFNQWGRPKVTTPRRTARDPAMARRLWAESVALTGCDR